MLKSNSCSPTTEDDAVLWLSVEDSDVALSPVEHTNWADTVDPDETVLERLSRFAANRVLGPVKSAMRNCRTSPPLTEPISGNWSWSLAAG
eukprot:1533220-Rhodomonas_salina.1